MGCVPSNLHDPIGYAKQLPDLINTSFCWTMAEACSQSRSRENGRRAEKGYAGEISASALKQNPPISRFY